MIQDLDLFARQRAMSPGSELCFKLLLRKQGTDMQAITLAVGTRYMSGAERLRRPQYAVWVYRAAAHGSWRQPLAFAQGIARFLPWRLATYMASSAWCRSCIESRVSVGANA